MNLIGMMRHQSVSLQISTFRGWKNKPMKSNKSGSKTVLCLLDTLLRTIMYDNTLKPICTGKLESPWETEKAQKPMVHFEDDEQMDEVFAFLSGIVKNTAEARQLTDEISFILDATIHALAGVHSLCEEAARQMYLRGPQYEWSERNDLTTRLSGV
ncbi:deoxyuridine 5'-triphosphate nucleotidohydrolase, mitochondrial isoform X2 [Paramormyrops kingsleyae]|uniref:deoxyuridine 5'-triphosphate nucleotidohydrolase, mitochondrial isoform X2 n=1 Tax=Paramormyrops kingsleyae TaxID=1676925 RepID=UPI003B96AFB6